MQIFLIIIAVLVLAIAVCLFISVRLSATYEKYDTSNAEVILKYGFITYKLYPKKKEKSKEEKEEDKPEKEPLSFEQKKQEIEKYIRIFNNIKGDVSRVLTYMTKRAVVFDNIEIKSEFGFEDAMQTGIFTGIYNGFVYSILGVIHNNSKLKKMDVNLSPNFDKKCFYNRFCCILHIKTVHIMIIAFKVLKIYRKIKKEGRK